MRLNISVESWAARMLLALAITPIASCTEVSVDARVVCQDPQPYLTPTDSGYEKCASGLVHHREVLACPALTPTACMSGANGSGGAGGASMGTGGSSPCATDTDCNAGANGFCKDYGPSCACTYGCITDADCGAGQVCLCGAGRGTCEAASCTSDADCDGSLCALEATLDAGGCTAGYLFACLTAADACTSSADCPGGATCARIDGHLACSTLTPDPSTCCTSVSCGRPFLIAGAHRQAEAASRSDWTASGQEPRLEGLDANAREALAAHWTRLGLMEHASIAAFARFSLQLLAVGAPPELLRDAQAAMADETEHTRLCFALASAYAGRSIGPGRLALSGALDAQDERAILITTIREGCIGETLAALEAAEAGAHAEDPAVRAVLARIAVDEERHALLAWRYVAWAIAGGGEELAAVAAAELDAALAEPMATGGRDDAMLVHGVTGDALGAEIRRQAIARVIRPAARAMLERA